LIDFRQKWQRGNNLKSKNEFVAGQYRSTPKTAILGQKVPKIHANISVPITTLNVHELPEFPRTAGNWRWLRNMISDFRPEVEKGIFAYAH